MSVKATTLKCGINTMKTCMKALQGRTLLALQGRTLLDKLYCICLIPWGLCRVPRGEIPEQKTDAYISGVWYTIARNQMKYNSTGKQITFENLAGNKGAEFIDTVAEFLV